ncbi:hypothetical protein GGP41_009944 [Bipolaris sorokiniana]|uniref:Uncharacterized protein n=1 Tax=Cochliobolus sativus TaxID=45130 RepID=A0A8H5ZEN5_COCSA|nr:hypothetical protein GGP41_009944 [Bipolaris sorokiniana]
MFFWEQIYSRLIFQSGVGFVYRQLFMHPPPIAAGVKLDSQTAIITGSNTGLGLEAARQLLQLDLTRLILAVRSEAKGNLAAEPLRNEFPHARVEVWILDMEDPESISAFATRCQALRRLDIAILNAGVQNKDCVISFKTGREQTFQVNYLSTIMLAVLLLPILKAKGRLAGKPARLTVVTSTTAYFADFDHEKAILPQFDENRSLEEGASTYVHAVVIAGRESHGGFLSEWGVRPFPVVMYSKRGEKLIKKVLSESRELLGAMNIPNALIQDIL